MGRRPTLGTMNILNPNSWLMNSESADQTGDKDTNSNSLQRETPQKMELNEASIRHLNEMMVCGSNTFSIRLFISETAGSGAM